MDCSLAEFDVNDWGALDADAVSGLVVDWGSL